MDKKIDSSVKETLEILSNEYLMQKISRGDAQFERGQMKEHELLEEKK